MAALAAIGMVVLIASLGFSELAAATSQVTRTPSYFVMFVSVMALIMLVVTDQRPEL
jgi:hypothetical protein